MPLAADHRRRDFGLCADQHQIERIAVLRAVPCSSCSTGAAPAGAEAAFVVHMDELVVAIQRVELHFPRDALEGRVERQEGETLGVLAGDEVDLHDLDALIQIRQHKAGNGRTRHDRIAEMQVAESRLQLAIASLDDRNAYAASDAEK